MPLTREDIDQARARLGLTGGTQPAVSPRSFDLAAEEPDGGRDFGILGDALGGVGRALSFADEPLSNRLGFNLPGPLDFLLEEVTRPSTLAIALAGAGLAPKIASLGFRGAGLTSALIAPAGGSSFPTRLAAETAIGLGARGGAELTQRFLPEDTPTPARVALGLAGGLVGGTAGFGATRAGVRSALGNDLLSPTIRLRPTEVEVGPRKGYFLNARTADQLRPDYDVNDVLDVARRSDANASGALEIMVSRGEIQMEHIGKAFKDSKGNWIVEGIRRKDGSTLPAYLETLVEFGPNRFDLTPQQVSALDRLHDIVTGPERSILQERIIFGNAPNETPLMEGQRWYPRRRVVKRGTTIGGGGKRLSGFIEKERQYLDPDIAIANGLVYDHPLQALDDYARDSLRGALNEHVAELLRSRGRTPLDRLDAELGTKVRQLRQRVFGRRRTLVAQQARAGVLDDEVARRSRELLEATEREFVRADTLNTLRLAEVTPQDISDFRRLARQATDDAISFTKASGRSHAIARELKLKLTDAEKGLRAESRQLRKLANELDTLLKGTEGPLEVRALSERGQEVLLGTAAQTARGLSGERVRQHRSILRKVSQVERRMADLAERSRSLDDRIEQALLKGATAEDIGAQARIQIEEALRGEREALRINQRIRAADLELRAAKAEAARTGRRQLAATGRAEQATVRAAVTEETIESMEQRLTALRKQWDDAKQVASRIPEGRARVDPALAPKLAGVDFDERDAQRIADYYAKGKPLTDPQFRGVSDTVRTVNRALIPLRATADFSAALNQLAALATGNPIRFLKNMGVAFRDMIDFTHYDRYLDEVAEDAARHHVAILGRGKRALSEFEFENWFLRNPTLEKVFGPFQRHFQSVTTRMRVDNYNAIRDAHIALGQPLDDLALDQVGRTLNRVSGISTSRAGDMETLLEFAPNFFRSTAETFWAAGTQGGIEGQLARHYMRNLIGFAAFSAAGVAVAQNRDPREVLSPISTSSLARGEVRINPNFLTVRIPGLGQDVSLMGRFDSFARLVVLAGDAGRGAISEQSIMPLVEAIEFFARTKGAPVLSTGISLAKGATFTGEPFPSARGLTAEVLPFSFSSFIEDWDLGLLPAAAGGTINAFGAKANPITPYERLREGAANLFDKDLDELTGVEREQLERAYPDLAARFRRQNEGFARQGDEKAQARIRVEEIDTERLERESAIVTAFQAGDLSRRDFAEALEDLQREMAIRKQETRTTLGVEFQGSTVGASQALSAWYATFDQAEIPGTGVVDWERRDEMEAQLFRVIDAGEFGDPAAARAAINERRRPAHTDPIVQQYFNDKVFVGQSGYYDVRDEQFARLSSLVNRIDPTVTSYGALLRAINRAELDGDVLQARRLKTVQNRIDAVVSTLRQRLRRTSPELDAALFRLGRVNTSARSA